MQPKVNKYKNVRTLYGARTFASMKEAQHAGFLDMMKKAVSEKERVAAVEYQVSYPLHSNGVKVGSYVADFLVHFADGRSEVHETKGFKTPVYKLKKKMFEAEYGVSIIEL